MDTSTRTAVRFARDAETRRRLGLPSASTRSTPMTHGDRTRRWTDDEIRASVRKLTNGRKVSRAEYKTMRAVAGMQFPHQDTVASRCPDMFA